MLWEIFGACFVYVFTFVEYMLFFNKYLTPIYVTFFNNVSAKLLDILKKIIIWNTYFFALRKLQIKERFKGNENQRWVLGAKFK